VEGLLPLPLFTAVASMEGIQFRRIWNICIGLGLRRSMCQVRSEVESGIEFLLEGRKRDPYKDLLPRLAYEYSWGGKQAPTFKI
jgi:hypothetical protein